LCHFDLIKFKYEPYGYIKVRVENKKDRLKKYFPDFPQRQIKIKSAQKNRGYLRSG